MTKIKILGDRIIFDGHADTQRECETVTLICDNLAKSEDFNTIKYESGYAEFERIGKTNDLMFAPSGTNYTMVFDSHITKVSAIDSYDRTFEWTTSGQTTDSIYAFNGPAQVFTVTLQDGYIIDAVTSDEAGSNISIAADGMSFTTRLLGDSTPGGMITVTITSKQSGASKKTIDVSTLSGWENLAGGNHSITIKTKASGYLDSTSSNAVTVSKAAIGYSVTFTDNTNGFLQENGWFYSTNNGETWIDISTLSNLTINGISQIKFKVNNKPSLYSGIDEANYVSITSQSLGVDITAYRNRDPIMSDNYTLSADVSDVVLYAMPD